MSACYVLSTGLSALHELNKPETNLMKLIFHYKCYSKVNWGLNKINNWGSCKYLGNVYFVNL